MKAQLTGEEHIGDDGKACVIDYWRWAYSDLLDNRNRAVFGEFIVANALDLQRGVRIEWDAVDLRYGETTIEVKTSAYIQSWNSQSNSPIRFDIAKKRGWDAGTNVLSDNELRAADLYVFCVLAEHDPGKINPLNLSQWEFYVLPTALLNEMLGDLKTLGLARLQQLTQRTFYSNLKQAIDAAINQKSG